MTDHPDRWPQVADAVRARMKVLGYLDAAPFIRASGLSEPFMRGILAGSPRGTPRGSSLTRLCKALGWSDDSVHRVLDGGAPVVVVAADRISRDASIRASIARHPITAPTVFDLERQVSQLRRWVVFLAERQGLVLDELDADEPPSPAATPAGLDDGQGLP